MDQFRALLRACTLERGDLARLSERSGVAQNLLSLYIRTGTRPSPRNLERLAPALGVEYLDLMKMCGYLPGAPSLERRVESFEAELRRWVAVMGPTMGAEAAERLFWEDVRRHVRDRVELAEAAANSAPQAEDNPAANVPSASLAPEPDDGAPGINRAYRPELVGAGR